MNFRQEIGMNQDVKNLARWITLVPAAALGAVVFYWFAKWGMKFMLSAPFLDSESFLLRGFAEFFSSLAMGVAFVYSGTKMAPAHKKQVSYVLSGLGLVVSGMLLYPAIQVQNYWSVWSNLWVIAGLAVAAYSARDGVLGGDE
jgi:hypothetical protein